MTYIKFPFGGKFRPGYQRINSRTISRVPVWGKLIVRNGSAVQYDGGYLTPIDCYMFASAQEVSDFLHADGRKGLYRITRNCLWWEAIKCVQMPTEKQALEKAGKHHFRYVYSWKKDEDVYA